MVVDEGAAEPVEARVPVKDGMEEKDFNEIFAFTPEDFGFVEDEEAEDLAAKSDLRWLELRLEARLSHQQKIPVARVAMVKWFAGVMIAQAAAIVALVKLLPEQLPR